MLVLSRKSGQRIKLGDAIRVTVIRVQGDQVRIGIEAPQDVVVLREELAPHELTRSLPPNVSIEVTHTSPSLEPAA